MSKKKQLKNKVKDLKNQVNILTRYVEFLLTDLNAILQLHKNVNGKCMGCPKSMNRDEGVVYADYPCATIQSLRENWWG